MSIAHCYAAPAPILTIVRPKALPAYMATMELKVQSDPAPCLRRRINALAIAAVILVVASVIVAETADACGAANGNGVVSGSAEDQYCEVPPDASGNGKPSRDLGAGDPQAVPAGAAAAMVAMGDQGADALRTARRTAPTGPGGESGEQVGGSLIPGIVAALSGTNGVGILLPLAMIVALILAVAYALAVRRPDDS